MFLTYKHIDWVMLQEDVVCCPSVGAPISEDWAVVHPWDRLFGNMWAINQSLSGRASPTSLTGTHYLTSVSLTLWPVWIPLPDQREWLNLIFLVKPWLPYTPCNYRKASHRLISISLSHMLSTLSLVWRIFLSCLAVSASLLWSGATLAVKRQCLSYNNTAQCHLVGNLSLYFVWR